MMRRPSMTTDVLGQCVLKMPYEWTCFCGQSNKVQKNYFVFSLNILSSYSVLVNLISNYYGVSDEHDI